MKRFFSANYVKKPKMELTIRTPYRTLIKDNANFTKLLTKTNIATLVVQNRMPPSIYILPAGELKVKLTEEVKGFSGTIMHTGGWAVIHPDNTCEINLMEAFEKDEINIGNIEKADPIKADNSVADKYAEKMRASTKKIFLKKAVV